MDEFPLDVFERAVLGRLREIDPRDILPAGDRSADRVLTLTGKLADAEARVEKVKASLIEGGEIAPLVGVLRSLEAKRESLATELAAASRAAASPLSAAWGEYRSLLDALDAAPDPDDARVRLRSALRRVVEGVWCLFVGTRKVRVAALRVQFAGGSHRDYMILHRGGRGNAASSRPPSTAVLSFAAVAGEVAFDLRKKRDAAKLARLLESIDLEEVAAAE